jgi:hypothetical protein
MLNRLTEGLLVAPVNAEPCNIPTFLTPLELILD